MLFALLRTLRPKQWIKNLFVGVPLVFGSRLADPTSFARTSAIFALFCVISGCVYVINDIIDVDKDRAHPKKRFRPIPSGELPPAVARLFVTLTVPVTVGLAFWLAPLAGSVLLGYFTLNLAYCFKLKNVPYVDVLSIALGFVLRVLAGAAAIDLPPSPWLLACTALLSMFLGFGKRAHELASSTEGTKQRSVLAHYRQGVLTAILYTLALTTAIVYGLYTESDHVRQAFGDARLIYTLPMPIIGIARFIYLVTTRHEAESPTEEMLRDIPFMLNFVAWLVVTALLLYGVI
jgi:4-hydroxybenzoate polyprenyltransferase